MGAIGNAIFVGLTLVTALAGFVLVGARTMERETGALADVQFEYVLSRAGEVVERSLQLGLPLEEIEQMMPVLESALARSPAILAADIFDPAGITLFSTDRGAVGEPIPTQWRIAIDNQLGLFFRAQEAAEMTLGKSIINDFEEVEGWAAIIVDRRALSPPLSVAPQLLRDALPVMLIAALIAAAAGAAAWSALGRRQLPLADVAHDDPSALSRRDGFDTVVGRAIAATVAADRTISEAREKMQRLDAEV